MTSESIGKTGKHSEFCEGHVECPKTGNEECGKELNFKLYANGAKECVTVMCFGCDEPHGVTEG